MASGTEQHLPVAARPPVFSRTKFLAPQPRATLVPRSALVQRLREAADLPLTIVVGSPGSGKSSLLTDWYRTVDDGSLAWLACDRGDDDPKRFWWGFIRAVQQVEPAFGVEAADVITLDGHVSTDALEALLESDARLDERVTLVIDDFHLVSLVAAEQLQHVLERGLAHLRLVIGSRSDPAVGLPRLRVQHAVAEVREVDLRLSLEETRALLGQIGLDPDTVDTPALLQRTEGWAAGVQMAALSVIGSEDPAARVRELAGTTQTIAGYLTAEVVANQSTAVQRFLEDTCVVDELDAAMCAALTDAAEDGVRVTLEQVEAANLLLFRVDAAGSAFRYHHLFGEMLRHRLHAQNPDRYREQHAKAAAHFLRLDDVAAGVRHLWLAGMADEAAQLMRDHLAELYMHTGTPPPVDVSAIPDAETLRTSPASSVGYAVGLMLDGQPQLASILMRRADLAAASAEGLPLLDQVHITGARIAAELATGNTSDAVTLTHRMLRLSTGQGIDDDPWLRIAIPFSMRAAVWEQQDDLYSQLLATARQTTDPRVWDVDICGVLALHALEQGEVEVAVERATKASAAALQYGVVGSGPHVATRAVLGAALVDTGRLAEATAELSALDGTLRFIRVPSYVIASAAAARIHRAGGSFDAALSMLAEARSQVRHVAPGPRLLARIDSTEIGIRLALGDVDAAARLQEGLPSGHVADLAAAWVATIRRDWAVVERLAEQLHATATTPRQQFDLALLRARESVDRDRPADDHAEALLAVAARSGLLLPIAEAGTGVLQAVNAAARRHARTPFVERLLQTRPLPRPADHARPAYRVDELSSRELIVLRYMATSMSNQEIAEALYLSVNTVKTHIKHVLRKLNASSRAEATRRAQELHYL